jgi:hypothetical protein
MPKIEVKVFTTAKAMAVLRKAGIKDPAKEAKRVIAEATKRQKADKEIDIKTLAEFAEAMRAINATRDRV